MEVFVPELSVSPVVLSLLPVSHNVDRGRPSHEDRREDGYWAAYIVKGRKTTRAKVTITLRDPSGANPLDRFDTLWADVHWINYGPFGRLARRQGVLVSLKRPQPLMAADAEFRIGEGCRVLPLRTHLLGSLDDPIDVLGPTPPTCSNLVTCSPSGRLRWL